MAHLLKGTMMVHPVKRKFPTPAQQAEPRESLTIMLFLLRINAPYDTDLLMTLNVPDKFSENRDGQSDLYAEHVKKADTMFETLVAGFTVEESKLKSLLGM